MNPFFGNDVSVFHCTANYVWLFLLCMCTRENGRPAERNNGFAIYMKDERPPQSKSGLKTSRLLHFNL